MNKPNKFNRIIFTGAMVFVTGIALSVRDAEASGPATCNPVYSVSYQPNNGGSVPDVLIVTCNSASGPNYEIFVGPANACQADAAAVQSMEAILLSARLTNVPVTMYYTTVTPTTCTYLGSNANIINFMTM